MKINIIFEILCPLLLLFLLVAILISCSSSSQVEQQGWTLVDKASAKRLDIEGVEELRGPNHCGWHAVTFFRREELHRPRSGNSFEIQSHSSRLYSLIRRRRVGQATPCSQAGRVATTSYG